MSTKIIREACIDSKESVDYYLKHLNDFERFETCSDLSQGGLTPTLELYQYIDKSCDKEQVIMIRNKNTFIIDSNNDLEIMKNQINDFLSLGARYFIFGYVTKDKKIDIDACKQLIDVVKSKPNTTWNFHMAIDEVENYNEAFETLISLGFTRVLTKGGKSIALDNINNLKNINEKYGNKIEILVGGKVTKDNYIEINKKTNITQFHGTRIA